MSHLAPRIKFFSKSDGCNVAYAIHGSGPVLIVPAWWVSHIDLDWEIAAYRQFFIKLGTYFTVVRYDRPGVGLSDRKRTVFTLEDEVTTLSELIAHLDLPQVSLLGVSCGGPPCILYTQSHPERVKRIIFIDSYLSGENIGAPNMQGPLCSLISAHWGLGAKAILDLFNPDMDSDTRAQMSNIHKRSASPDMAAALLKLSFSMNATDAANHVNVPALIIHHSKDKTVPFSAGRTLAAKLTNSQLISIEGKAHVPWLGDKTDDIIQEIITFSGLGESATSLPIEHNQFKKSGNIWTLSYAGTTVHIKDSRGLNDIALLIQKKGEEIHAAELVNSELSVPNERPIAVSDPVAMQQYKDRLTDISEQKNSAAATGDELGYAKLDKEEQQLIDTLKQSTGLGGRTRSFNHNSEKARKAVAARIRASLNKIASVAPELAAHLNSAIKTGNYCSYAPAAKISWLI